MAREYHRHERAHRARIVERALCRVPGLNSAKVDFGLGMAIATGTVRSCPILPDAAKLVEAVAAQPGASAPNSPTRTGGLKFYLRRLVEHFSVVANIEEFVRREPEGTCE
jgi:hypothetical protein